MRLLVTDPNGNLWQTTGLGAGSRTRDWDIQRVNAPTQGSWRFQLARRHTRVVSGFASDAFEDHAAGVALVRRELQRLCPDGSDDVLYFEDGRMDSGHPSVYADALAAEGQYGTGLIQPGPEGGMTGPPHRRPTVNYP